MTSGYDYATLYGQADMSAGQLIDIGDKDAVVETSEWGRSSAGDKGQWTVKFRLTSGPQAGASITTNLTVNPRKNDGGDNSAGLGIMFRQLGALGIPVPPNQPFWALGWTEQQVAQAMVGRPVQLQIKHETWSEDKGGDGSTRAKVRDIRPPRPGAPTSYQPQQQAPQQAYAQPQQQFAQPQQQFGYQGQPQQGQYQQQAPPAQQAPQPWQQQPQQPPAQQQIPGAPSWAQPPVPGQGGTGEFTPQGQSYQPSYMQPGQMQQPQPPQQPQGYGAPATGAPAPGAQYQQGAPSPSSQQAPAQPNGYPQQQQAPQQPQAPGGAPDAPPWAQ